MTIYGNSRQSYISKGREIENFNRVTNHILKCALATAYAGAGDAPKLKESQQSNVVKMEATKENFMDFLSGIFGQNEELAKDIVVHKLKRYFKQEDISRYLNEYMNSGKISEDDGVITML